MKSLFLIVSACVASTSAFSLPMSNEGPSRRNFLQKSVATTAAIVAASTLPVSPASAAPEIFTTSSGLKYAVLQQPKDLSKAIVPAKGDVVSIEYTGYLSNGQIFDGTHGEGKANFLTFRLGEPVVVDGVTEMLGMMGTGQKVQVIVPPSLAFGDKGLCLGSGECLIKPGQTLVYDLKLKKTAVPPP